VSTPDGGADAGDAAATPGRDPPERTRLRQFADEQVTLRSVATLGRAAAIGHVGLHLPP
jgi:hypothetical protein